MITTVPPVNVVANTPTSIAAQWAGPDQVQYMVVYNNTNSIVSVQGSGGAKYIYPANADVIDVEGWTNLSINPPAIGQVGPNPLPSPLVLGCCPITLYDPSETIPAGFPYTLPGNATDANNLLVWEYAPPTSGGGSSPWYFQPPPNATSIIVGTPGNPLLQTIQITGVTSGVTYYQGSLSSPVVIDLRFSQDIYLQVTYAISPFPITVYSSIQAVTPIAPQFEDASGNNQYLVSVGATLTVPSPGGPLFKQALQMGPGGGSQYLQGPQGSSGPQGAIILPAWSLKLLYQPSVTDITYVGNLLIASRLFGGTSGREWGLGLASGVLTFWYFDNTGTLHTLSDPAGALIPDVPYFIGASVAGSSLVNVFLLKNFATAASVGSIAPPQPPTDGWLIIGHNPFTTFATQGTANSTIDDLSLETNVPSSGNGPEQQNQGMYALYHFDTGDIPISAAPSFTVQVPNPPVNSEWAYTLPFPARLKKATATFVAAGVRTLNYAVTAPNYGALEFLAPMMTAQTTAGTYIWTGFPNGNYNDVTSTFGALVESPVPDEVMPAGTVIESRTAGIAGGDQWSNILLSLSTY